MIVFVIGGTLVLLSQIFAKLSQRLLGLCIQFFSAWASLITLSVYFKVVSVIKDEGGNPKYVFHGISSLSVETWLWGCVGVSTRSRAGG